MVLEEFKEKIYIFRSSSVVAYLIIVMSEWQEMTPDAEIISTRYTKSAIKSCAALSYVEAQARMDDRFHSFLSFSFPFYIWGNCLYTLFNFLIYLS